jgi:regulator of sigma E protease
MPNENNKLGIGFNPDPEDYFAIDRFQYGLLESVDFGLQRTNETVSGIIGGFSKMFSGDISVRDNLGGPVAIANVTKQATDAGGFIGFWNITAFLSITLAIMNILPIPVLDGGHLMFLIYEGITRREPSPKVRMALQQIGFLLIIALFIFVTFNDILRQFG